MVSYFSQKDARLFVTVFLLSVIGFYLTEPPEADAGCGSYGYSYRPSYNYGYGYNNYNYGYSNYYYQKPYYPDYYFTKFVAAIPLVEFPTYSAVYTPTAVTTTTQTTTTGAAVAAGVKTIAAPPTPTVPAPAAPAPTPTGTMCGAEAKLDKLLIFAEQTSNRLTRLEQRVMLLEARTGGGNPNPAGSPVFTPSTPGNNLPPSGPGIVPPAEANTPKLPDAKQVRMNKCAACHAQGKEDDGGGLAFMNTDGSFIGLTSKQQRNYVKHVNGGTMPPRNNKKNIPLLTDAEAYVLIAESPNIPDVPAAKKD